MNQTRHNKLHLAAKILLVAGGAALLLLLFNFVYLQDRENQHHEVDKYRELAGRPAASVLIASVGSSHGQYGLNYAKLEAEGYSCFNFGLESQPYIYDLAFLQQYGDKLEPGGILFIPVSYFSFNDEAVTDTEREERSVRYYWILDPANNPDYSWYTDLVAHRLPVLTAYEKLFDVIPDILAQRRAQAAAAATDSTRTARFEELGKERYERHVGSREPSAYFQEAQIETLGEIIDFVREKKLTPVLITTPYTVYYTRYLSPEFLAGFRETVDSVCAEKGVFYYDYSHDARFETDLSLFADPDHLNPEGAQAFVSVLAAEVPEFAEVLAAHPVGQ